MGGSGISWTICKSFGLRSRQITMPTPKFLWARCSSCHPTNSCKALKEILANCYSIWQYVENDYTIGSQIWYKPDIYNCDIFYHIYIQAKTSLRSVSAWMPITLCAPSICGFSCWVRWECYLPVPIETVGTQHSVRNMALASFVFCLPSVRWRSLVEIWCCIGRTYIITMTPIDIGSSPCVTNRWHASACKISLQYIAPFQRR